MKTDGEQYQEIHRNLQGVNTFDFDIEQQEIYMFSFIKKEISKANVHGNGDPPQPVLALNHSSDGIAIDWVNRKMYWADTTNKRILVAELDGSKQTTLVETGLGNPRALAIDPIRG